MNVLNDMKIPSDKADFKITKIDYVKGDMDVCNRRGKIIFIYDVKLKFGWRGVLDQGDEKIKGKGTVEILDIDNTQEFIVGIVVYLIW